MNYLGVPAHGRCCNCGCSGVQLAYAHGECCKCPNMPLLEQCPKYVAKVAKLLEDK